MNVLFVSHSAELTGAPLSCYHLMARIGPDVRPVFATPSPGPLLERVEAQGIRAHVLGPKGFMGLGYVRAVRRIIALERIDVVHCNTLTPVSKYAALAARTRGAPVVWFVRENPSISRSRRLMKWARRLASRIVFVDDATRREAMGADTGDSRIETLPNGVDLKEFAAGDSAYLRERFGIPLGAPLVGYLGMVTERKGVEHLVRAMARVRERLPEARLFIIGGWREGDEGYAGGLKKLIGELGLASGVHFTGPLEDVREALWSLDLVVLPSLEERCSRTLIEALAAGKPCVATRVGGTPGIVMDGANGLLVPPEDHESLADACVRILSDAELRMRMGREGRARAERLFDIRLNVERAKAIYREAIEG